VACCLNVTADHLGLGGIHTVEQLAEVKRIPIEVARDTAVLNADDPLCLRMAEHTQAKHICYVDDEPDNASCASTSAPAAARWPWRAGVNGQMITLYDKGAHMPLLWTHLIPATVEGRALHNVQNAMFAAAMAYAMGVKLDDIRHGLRTFDSTFFQTPGRMNVFDKLGFKVILDYGHNPAAVDAMCTLTDGLAAAGRCKAGGKRVVVLAVPGDRRNEDIEASPAARRAASTTSSAGATTTRAGAAPTRCRGSCAHAHRRGRVSPDRIERHHPRARRGRPRAEDLPARRPAPVLRRPGHAHLEADHLRRGPPP
jgi:cyanophycin synthetase